MGLGLLQSMTSVEVRLGDIRGHRASALLAGTLTPGDLGHQIRCLRALRPPRWRDQREMLSLQPSPPNHCPGHRRGIPLGDPSQCHVDRKPLPAEPCPEFLTHSRMRSDEMVAVTKLLRLGVVCFAATDNWSHTQWKPMHVCTKRYAQGCLGYHSW